MIKPKTVVLDRVEGKLDQKTCGTYAEANFVLRNWARTAPNDGAYDKIDFFIVFEDGEIYTGRFDLQKKHMIEPSPLEDHLLSFVRFMAGLNQGGFDDIGYKNFLESYPNEVKSYQEFLNKYDIGQK